MVFKGTVVVAVEIINPPVFLPSAQTGPGTAAFGFMNYSIYDGLIRFKYSAPPDLGEPSGEGLAESWQVAPDLSRITFKIRAGAQFHRGYGEVSARDIKWTFDEALKEGTKNTRAASVGPYTAKWEVLDDRTAVLHLKPGKLDPAWPLHFSGLSGSIPIVSKRLYDQEGEQKALTTEAGSGPFVTTKWTTQEEIRAEPVPNHWRQTARVKELRLVSIPEVAGRIAALKAGEVQIAPIPSAFMDAVLGSISGSRFQPLGKHKPQVVYFGGNYWAKTDYATGAALPKREGFKPDKDHPWIGDPDDAASMERARKVRLALSMAIDRETIVKQVFAGRGRATYTYIDVLPDSPRFKKEWFVPYDVAKAKQLLTEAGYASGFSFSMWVPPDNPAAINLETGEAVAQMWRGLGLGVSVEKTAYAARRPSWVNRTMDIPHLFIAAPLTLDEPMAVSLLPSSGLPQGIELGPEIEKLRWANTTEPDRETRIQNNIKIQDFLTQWALVAPVATMDSFWIIRPEVLEWRPYQPAFSWFNSPETIVMK